MSNPYPFTAELCVETYLHGVRIDSFLVKHFRNYTPYRMQRLIRAGQVHIEGALAETADRVYKGQSVRVRLLEPPDHLLPPEPMPLSILYEDPWLIVLNKPAGIVVHPCGNYSTGSLANGLQAHLDQQTQLPGLVRPGVVHRLDRLTSGVIVLTKEHVAHRRLSIHFQEHRVAKGYLALVHGVVECDEGVIDFPIGKTPGGSTIMMSVGPDAQEARRARTRYEVVERFARFTLVRALPQTGRLHQIRVHLAGIGHPILADEFYSPSATFGADDVDREFNLPREILANGSVQLAGIARMGIAEHLRRRDRDDQDSIVNPESLDLESPDPDTDEDDEIDQLASPRSTDMPTSTNGTPPLLTRQALHAHRLEFVHPITRDVVCFEAPLATDMQAVLDLLRTNAGVRP